jgi:hypothetical protein
MSDNEPRTSTTVVNGGTDADGPMQPSSVRGTEEYAAAFDLEVWKAEQRTQFEETNRVELERKRRALDVEFAQRDVARLEEVDALRRELEAMASRLHTTGKVLSKRITNQEKREEAYEARRLQHAAESEFHIHELESRHRRAMDEQFLKHESLASQLKERDLVAQQAHQRLTVLQQEYDALQRLVSRLQTRETSESATISELRSRSETMAGTIRELQSALESKNKSLEVLLGEKEELVAACRLYKTQVKDITNEYNRLASTVQAERERALTEEQERLASLARQSDLLYRCGDQVQHQQLSPLSPSDYLARTFTATRGGAPLATFPTGSSPVGSHVSTEIGALRQLVDQLRNESARDEKAHRQKHERREKKVQRKREQQRASAQQTLVGSHVRYAEGDDHRLGNVEGVDANHLRSVPSMDRPRSVSPLRVTGSVGEVLFGNHSPLRDHEAADTPVALEAATHQRAFSNAMEDDDEGVGDDCVSVSSTSSRGAAAQLGSRRHRRHERPPPRDTDAAADERGHPPTQAIHHSADVSFSSSGGGTYSYVSGLEWPPSMSSGATATVTTPSGTTSYDVPPPLRGETRTTDSSSGSSAALFPRGLDMHGQGSLPDIREFVHRLKDNRSRLIETGVYLEADPLMQDMAKKIRVYEHYLKAHFQ